MHESQKKKVDAQHFISSLLGLVNYWRLMAIMLALGLLAGIGYYIYATPTFLSRTLVNLRIFSTPIDNQSVAQDTETPSSQIRRALITELQSRHIGLNAARSLGIVGQNESYETVLDDHVPKLQIDLLDTNNLQITVYAYSPRVVREFPDALIKEYRKHQLEIREHYRTEALNLYQKDREDLLNRIAGETKKRTTLEQKEKAASAFIEMNKLSQAQSEIVLIKERLIRMEEVKRDLKGGATIPEVIEQLSLLSLFEKETIVSVGNVIRSDKENSKDKGPLELDNTPPPVIVQPSMVQGIEPWRDLEKELRTIKIAISEGAVKWGPKHEEMIRLRSREEEIEKGLRGELVVQRQRFDLDRQRNEDRLKELESKVPELPEMAQKYEQFKKTYNQIEKVETMYDKSLALLEAKLAALQTNLERDSIELTNKGFVSLRDEDPVSPNKMKLLLVALTVGVGGALAASWIMRFFNTTTSRLVDLEAASGLKGMGLIPFTSKQLRENIFRSPIIGSKVPNFLLECFRLIRAQICLHKSRNGKNQVIMITSARPSEGKTSLAANLAWAFYSMGEKTLLVDCDLRRGRVHSMTATPNDVGLSMVMTGQLTEEEARRETREERLTVVTRGPIIVGATEMLIQPFFEEIVNYWRTQFDRIILDCPPVLGLSETCALSHVADGLVLVVRAEVTPRKDVLDAVDLLHKANADIMGFVLNALDLQKIANSYQYYYYSADYYDEFQPRNDDDDGGSPVTDDTTPPRGGGPRPGHRTLVTTKG